MLKHLHKELVPIVRKIYESETEIDDSFLYRDYDIAEQEKFGCKVIKDMGFDMNRGRLDVSAHPFTAGTEDDVRMTTRYKLDDLKPSIFAVVHEAGHGLYEQGFLKKHYRTPMASSISLGWHESQSRLWENFIGRSWEFWGHYYPQLRTHFPSTLKGIDQNMFYKGINRVKPSLIRVEADEVTYNLHVILRYELESQMLEGNIDLSELPVIWNERMEKYLGVIPPDNATGVLQDIHWSLGFIGYFPTYTLGNIYAGQIYHKLNKEMPNLSEDIGRGRFLDILNWLRKNIHNKGNLLTASDLAKELLGETLNDRYLLDYIKDKFGNIYGVRL